MGKAQRRKGAEWEREVARMLREAGVLAKRGLGQARNASEAADVQVEGWWVECKVGGPAAYPRRALQQASQACLEAGRAMVDTPVAICKQDRREPTATWWQNVEGVEVVVTVSLEDWIRIVAAEHRAKEDQNAQRG